MRGLRANAPREAYRAWLADRQRHVMTLAELTGFTWNFRFKQAAGRSFVSVDPYWLGQQPRTAQFYADGSTSSAAAQARTRLRRLSFSMQTSTAAKR